MSDLLSAEQIEIIRKWLGSGSVNIFGMPFSGKDTQGRTLADLLDAPLLGGGDILRNSIIPPRSQEALKKGLLIPTDEYIDIVLPFLGQDEFKDKPLVLSSVGRWSGEEKSVIQVTEQAKHPMKAVFYLDITEEEARARLAKSQEEKSRGERGNRSDDVPEVFEIRLKEFREKTMPVIKYYEKTPLLKQISADKPAIDVTGEIIEDLLLRAQS
jgi:adenylate kinase